MVILSLKMFSYFFFFFFPSKLWMCSEGSSWTFFLPSYSSGWHLHSHLHNAIPDKALVLGGRKLAIIIWAWNEWEHRNVSSRPHFKTFKTGHKNNMKTWSIKENYHPITQARVPLPVIRVSPRWGGGGWRCQWPGSRGEGKLSQETLWQGLCSLEAASPVTAGTEIPLLGQYKPVHLQPRQDGP